MNKTAKFAHLTDFFLPENYQIKLDIADDRRHFGGHVIITGQKKSNQAIRLHWHNSNENFHVIINGQVIHHIEFHDNDEVILGELTDQIIPKNVPLKIDIRYEGKIIDGSMIGLYPAKYGKNELLTTQFESTGARRVFPCVDEPAAKATFDLSITADKNFAKTIISNQPETAHQTHGDRLTVDFATTPKMSTYLLAFVIGNLQKISRQTKRGVVINVFATPLQNPKSLTFAADFAARVIDFYEQYFGVEYPLAKSDHVAVPDFSAGAMENWGLVTYRESCLLVTPNDALSQKQYVATVIAHELAHQWFGDLVTMQWWDDLWLNESFANFMENFTTDQLYPDWHVWQSYESTDVVAALRRDAIPGVQAVRETINDPAEIDTLFDAAIVYAKGGRMLRMVHSLVGDDAWRAGLKSYFHKHAYSNTTMNDLWNEISKASTLDFNLTDMMNDLLTRPGYPVVNAKLTDETHVQLDQKRFLTTDDDTKNERPFAFPLFANDKTAPRIMHEQSTHFAVSNPTNFQLNMGNNAHFIANYDTKLRASLNQNFAKFSVSDRLKLLNEAQILANSISDYLPESALIPMLNSLAQETNYAVWSTGSRIIADLTKIVENDEAAESSLKKLTRRVIDPVFQKIVDAPKNDNNAKLWPILLGREIWANNENVIRDSLALFARNKVDLTQINGEIRSVIFANAVKNGEAEEFDFLFDQYKISTDATLKDDLMAGLTSSEKPDQIEAILTEFTNQSVIRPQNLPSSLAMLLANRFARAEAWRWLRDNWDYIAKLYAGDMSFSEFPQIAGGRLSTAVELAEFREFFDPLRKEPMLTRIIALGERDIETRVTWIQRNRNAVIAKLRAC